MNILIVEDEELAVKKMKKTLMQVEPTANVVGITESIQSTVEWLENNNKPDLILMDIELSDGQSFEIFNRVKVNSAVIFTTSYDEYALKAFKVNSIDYLLKPIQSEDLEAAIGKYKSMRSLYKDQGSGSPDFNLESIITELKQKLQPQKHSLKVR